MISFPEEGEQHVAEGINLRNTKPILKEGEANNSKTENQTITKLRSIILYQSGE